MENEVIQEKNYITELFTKVFLWMFMGLFATGIVSWFTYAFGMVETLATIDGFKIIAVIEGVVVLIFSIFFRKLPPLAVSILFFIYAVVNGVSFSVIFYIFDINSIFLTFFATAAIFGITGAIGYFTKIDLSKFMPIFLITLTVGIIVNIINIFVGNDTIDIVVTWILLLVFFGITIYDFHTIKNMAMSGYDKTDKLHIYGAMNLYLDFINIFLRILGLFGKRK